MRKKIDRLLRSGAVVQCSACAELSAHAWQDSEPQDPKDPDTVVRLGWHSGQIAHVGATDSWSWECGHCGAYNVDPDAPILHPCYTHAED